MLDTIESPAGQVVLALTACFIVVSIGVYVVLKFRDSIGSDDSTGELLSKFQEMKHEGHIDAEEYRNIKTNLGDQLSQQSSNPTGEELRGSG